MSNPTDDVPAASSTRAGTMLPSPRNRRAWTFWRRSPEAQPAPPADGYTATLDALALLRAQAAGDKDARRRVLRRYPMPASSVSLLAAVVTITDRVGTSAGGSSTDWAAYLDRESARMIMRDLDDPGWADS